jgi:hypothetical protein
MEETWSGCKEWLQGARRSEEEQGEIKQVSCCGGARREQGGSQDEARRRGESGASRERMVERIESEYGFASAQNACLGPSNF